MKLAIGSDHAGFALKERLRATLLAWGHEVADQGTDSEASTDYPLFAAKVARAVGEGRAERGLLVCGTGIGMAIAANRLPQVRAANCNDIYSVRLAREHNDANVLTLGARVVAAEHAEALLREFLATPFAGGRHQRRVDQLAHLAEERSAEPSAAPRG
jgi:ribose 5-phosphate isomerase B